ncbi:glycosyltransferase [Hymenobacter jeollabukensis]|uniref:Glycosyltransferase subfamily 4-like N-terminal domain-containing protein n=1 Tax=Hymenobacter jeollabukensis TaxID=2025313 RepID=A0A5R8WLS8_9BACT|nr:glycosyltransferase [Hymenobacter jeollabukensis]TLM90092.1 hypothetical protein FDY95_18930 [Hymenobacter jeollabukensis]
MPAAPSSVLLLGWDDTSAALPLARQLSATSATELWTAAPLAAPAAHASRSLDVVPPLPAVLPVLGHRVPAFPYVGRGVGLPQPVAVPAAPYVGSSAAPAETPPETTARAAASGPATATTDRPMAVPAAPYIGAAHHADSALLNAPVPDYRLPVGTLSAMPSSPATAAAPAPALPADVAPAAEPGPAEAAELSSEAPLPLAAEIPAPPADSDPSPAATELLPEPVAAFDDPALDADDVALLAAPPDAAGLNFRIIQYARHAARLAHESTFEVIFAPDWHTWLAGVELRQLTRRPLVLQLTQLATDLATPAERGWVEALERITLPQADRILVPDDATAARLRQRYRQLAGRVFVLPAGAPALAAALVLDSRFSH